MHARDGEVAVASNVGPSDIIVSKFDGIHLILSIRDSDDAVVVVGGMYADFAVRFTDGTTWSATDIRAAFKGDRSDIATGPPPTPLLPSYEQRREACEFAASTDPATRLQGTMVRSGDIDVDNDGRVETVAPRVAQGTMGGDAFEITNGRNEQINWVPIGHEWKLYWTFGAAWFAHKGHTYLAHFAEEDGAYLSHLSYITPNHLEFVICEFANSTSSALTAIEPARVDHAIVCDAIREVTLDYDPVVDFLQPTEIPVEPASQGDIDKYNQTRTRAEAHLLGTAAVDFDNDGETENLALLEYSSGAGRGCEHTYFDVRGDAGQILDAGAEHELLMALSHRSCRSNNPRWFVIQGTIYFENRYPGLQPRLGSQHIDDVFVVKSGGIEKICEGRFAVRSYVTRLYMPYLTTGTTGVTLQ